YPAFFHCFLIQPQFHAALALHKQAALCRQRGGTSRRAAGPGEAACPPSLQAWRILEPSTAVLDGRLRVDALACESPLAGRLLRNVYRLRRQLRDALAAPARP